MKTFYLFMSLVCASSVLFAQNETPEEQTFVNKEYDEDGNLIAYDSTFIHTWSSDTTYQFPFGQHDFFAGNFEELEKMLNEMINDSMLFKRNFSSFQDFDHFHSFAHPDSSFSGVFQFFNDSAFFNQEFVFPDVKEIQKQMEEHFMPFDFFEEPEFIQELTEEQLKEFEELKEKHKKEMEELRKSWENEK